MTRNLSGENALIANVNRYLRNLQRSHNIMSDSELGHQLSALMFLLDNNEDGALVQLALLEPYDALERLYQALLSLTELTHRELARREADMEDGDDDQS